MHLIITFRIALSTRIMPGWWFICISACLMRTTRTTSPHASPVHIQPSPQHPPIRPNSQLTPNSTFPGLYQPPAPTGSRCPFQAVDWPYPTADAPEEAPKHTPHLVLGAPKLNSQRTEFRAIHRTCLKEGWAAHALTTLSTPNLEWVVSCAGGAAPSHRLSAAGRLAARL